MRTPYRTPLEDFIITPGDIVRGEDDDSGSNVLIRGGNSTSGDNVGGTLEIRGGTGSNNGAGGPLILYGGTAGPGGSGGAITIGGLQSGNSVPGVVSLLGNSRASTGTGGLTLVSGGTGTSATGGILRLRGGPGGGTSASGGDLEILGGSATDAASGGDVLLTGGSATGAGVGGDVVITPGSTVGGTDGEVLINGPTTVDNTLTATDSLFGTQGNFSAGVSCGGATRVGTNGFASLGTWALFSDFETNETTKAARLGVRAWETAQLPVTLCIASALQTVNTVNFGGGSGVGQAATRVSFWSASTVDTATGTEQLRMEGSGHLLSQNPGRNLGSATAYFGTAFTQRVSLLEQSSSPGGAAGRGTLWVRDDTPNVLIFTDGAGTDHELGAGGGAGSLADTLVVGNETGGTDVVVSDGDSITGEDEVDANAGGYTIRAGDVTAPTTTRVGGDLLIRAGNLFDGTTNASRAGDLEISGGDFTSTFANGRGGNAIFRAGDGRAANSVILRSGVVTTSSGVASQCYVIGGDRSIGGNAGGTLIRGGDVDPGGSAGFGGNLNLRGGNARNHTTAGGGDVTIRSGVPIMSTSQTTPTGDIRITTNAINSLGGQSGSDAMPGGGNENTRTGSIQIDTLGNGTSGGAAGSISLLTATNRSTTTNRGDLILEAGGGTASGGAGNLTLHAGDSSYTATLANGKPGDVSIAAGDMTSTSTSSTVGGGHVTITAGDSRRNNATAPAGSVHIEAGSATDGINTPAGDVNLVAGTAVGALVQGDVTRRGSSPIGTEERCRTRQFTSSGGTSSIPIFSMPTNERNRKFDVFVSGQYFDASVGGLVVWVGRLEGVVLRDGAGAITVVMMDNRDGPPASGVSADLTISGTEIHLELTPASAEEVLWTAIITTQGSGS